MAGAKTLTGQQAAELLSWANDEHANGTYQFEVPTRRLQATFKAGRIVNLMPISDDANAKLIENIQPVLPRARAGAA